jgi:hypothetical protein
MQSVESGFLDRVEGIQRKIQKMDEERERESERKKMWGKE